MRNFGKRALLKVVTLAAAGTVLSGCVYDVGLGYASDGYYDDYSCDPYSGYDSYYDCDYGSGFFNIGFGGGWYDSYWYPGHGYYLFDNYGHRHIMRQHHRRYWGERRHSWYRENRGRHRGNGRNEGRDHSNATPGAIGWPERNGGGCAMATMIGADAAKAGEGAAINGAAVMATVSMPSLCLTRITCRAVVVPVVKDGRATGRADAEMTRPKQCRRRPASQNQVAEMAGAFALRHNRPLVISPPHRALRR